MKRFTRRTLFAGGALFAAALALRYSAPAMLRHAPPRPLLGRSKDVVDGLYSDVDKSKLWDVHVHALGTGNGSDCYVNPALQSHLNLKKRLQYDFYMAAAGFASAATKDRAYIERLIALSRLANPEGRLVLMAFDYAHDEKGKALPAESNFYIPNDYVLALAKENIELEACVSIHPYRHDAVERLQRAVVDGARAVKWLPAAMRIDPQSPRCDAFYAELARNGLPLITHAGEEAAVDAEEWAKMGNPLRLRRPLDAGVRVVVAHCAGLGMANDLDNGGAHVEAFTLFARLFDSAQYKDHLFADISAMTQFNRAGLPLQSVLQRKDWHPRLVNGSDYPLPAVDPLVSTRRLVQLGYLTAEDRVVCNDVYAHNPMLFDYVVKRLIRYKDASFSPSIFETRWLFGEGQ